MKQSSASPTGAETKTKEDEKNVTDWGSGHGNNIQSYNAGAGTVAAPAAGGKAPSSLAQVKAVSPTGAETKIKEDEKNVTDWGSGHGNNIQAYNAGAGTVAAPAAGGKAPAALAQTKTEKKERITTNTSKQVAADLEKEKSQELVVPHQKADNDKDSAPQWAQNEKHILEKNLLIYN